MGHQKRKGRGQLFDVILYIYRLSKYHVTMVPKYGQSVLYLTVPFTVLPYLTLLNLTLGPDRLVLIVHYLRSWPFGPDRLVLVLRWVRWPVGPSTMVPCMVKCTGTLH